jgi:hypothetical protein
MLDAFRVGSGGIYFRWWQCFVDGGRGSDGDGDGGAVMKVAAARPGDGRRMKTVVNGWSSGRCRQQMIIKMGNSL